MVSETEHNALPTPAFKTPPRILIVRAPYYKVIADDLLAGAKGELEQAGAQVALADVPGALEIPPAIAIARHRFDGFVALGCVIRGETTHYDTVCNDSSRGLMQLGLQGICIGNGILTVENDAQARMRADPKGQNKGGGAANAALHLVRLARDTGARPSGKSFAPDSEHIIVAGKP